MVEVAIVPRKNLATRKVEGFGKKVKSCCEKEVPTEEEHHRSLVELCTSALRPRQLVNIMPPNYAADILDLSVGSAGVG
jgi:hypothetical protein